jgi:AcrR family transcriptional regulator
VLDAAYALFEDRGYEQTTMRAVAERAGVALGTIFVHFSDKHALLMAAFETDLARVIEDAFVTVPPDDVRRQLLHVARRLYDFYGRRPRLSRVLVQQAFFADGDAGARLSDQVRSFLGRLAGLFEAAAARGEVRRDVSASDAALCFWADYFTVLVAALRDPELHTRGQLRLLGGMLDLRFTGIAAATVRGSRRKR